MYVISAFASFIILSLIFIPLELAFPANPKQRIFRKKWILDVCYFFGQYLIWGSIVFIVLNYFESWLNTHIDLSFRTKIHALPLWLQCFIVIISSDLLVYWAHRLQHKVDFLWQFHKIHHSAETLDWLASHREHPLDSIYTIGVINLPAILLGFDLNVLYFFILFRGIWAIYIHSNVRVNIGFLKYIIGSPELHHWHHDKERDRGNYANISPLLDILFKTHVCPNHEPNEFGIKEEFSSTYFGQLIQPFAFKRTRKISNVIDE